MAETETASPGEQEIAFTKWLDTLSIDIREDLDMWSARQGWDAAIRHLRLDLESLDLLHKMQPLPQHTEEESE